MARYVFGRWEGRWATVSALVVAVFATMLVCTASAGAAEAPRWVIKAMPTPTHIKTDTPRNEVQRLTVSATGGTYALEVTAASGTNGTTSLLPYDATAAEVRSAITQLYEAKVVSVVGGPATATPNEYEITFEGENGDVDVPLLRAEDSHLQGGGASIVEVARGASPSVVEVIATNVGGAATSGTITLTDVLPSWMKVTNVEGVAPVEGFYAASMSCQASPAVACTYEGSVESGGQLNMSVMVSTGSSTPAGTIDHATIEGGGAASSSIDAAVEVGSTPAVFGPAPGSVVAAISNNRAGAHPNVITSFWVTTNETDAAEGLKDVSFDLPPGLVGNAVGMPQCTASIATKNGCPEDTRVGTANIMISGSNGTAYPEVASIVVPVYNITPSPGEPAAFAFNAILLPVRLDTSVLSNGNYGVRVTAPDIAESAEVIGTNVTIWGVPAEHFKVAGQNHVPLLTNPQQCQEPLMATMAADGWSEPGVFRSEDAQMGSMSDCDLVPFSSSFSFLPDTLEAGAPAGYAFDLNIPQQNTSTTLATSSLKDFKLELPEGVVVNPSAAWGLKACSDSQFYGPDHPSQAPALPSECPREAKVGEVEVETPDLEHPLKGDVFLGAPECDPCSPVDAESGKMVRLFVQLVGEGEAGVIVKLEGRADIDQKTGRITTFFDGTPQVPFNRLHFVLEGGPRAVLANPRSCGPVKAMGDLTPWNSLLGAGEEGIVSDSRPFYEFEITQGCFGAQFNPTLKAGSPNIQAGEYSPFTLAFGRADQDQYLGSIALTMPPGLLGNIGSVPLCKEPEASRGTCGQESLIGHVNVLTGPGADPFLVSGGQVFLTESYDGAPYGLSIVVPAVAGPYTLSGTTGNGTVVVRAKIQVDPIDAHLTVTSDPLPSMLDGIPLQLKVVNVIIDKPDFTFNPTNCSKMAIDASVGSIEGMRANLSSSFQVTNCAKLSFKPQFKVTTSGKTSRKNGASLDVRLSYPKAAFGSQANIAEVKVDLPKQLPSRLTTLQKACIAHTFEVNPAACPADSRVGMATATTPIIPVPLSGPAYFVSYGGAKFPELVIVLSGYGVTVQLHGETFINKVGITSSTFRVIPDVPIGSFELKLPEGPFSALAANGDVCTSKLAMPTAFTAQNGTVIKQSTPVTATGCPKHKAKKAKHKQKAKSNKG